MIDERVFRKSPLNKDNPVLIYKLKRVSWSCKRSGLRRYVLIVLGIFVLAIAAICAWDVLGLWVRYGYLDVAVQEIFYSVFFNAILAVSTLIGLFLDLCYINLPARQLLREKESGRWDLLRTTALPGVQIIAAEYAVAQLRAWRVLAIEVALRAAISVLATLM